jgi:DNA-directed RNA polymerase specialized sigma24 family protein
MSDITRVLEAAQGGDPDAPEQLLPLLYDELRKLRYFIGMTVHEAAKVLGISPDTAKDDSAYARAWLYREINRQS